MRPRLLINQIMTMQRLFISCLMLTCLFVLQLTAQKEITLEDIWYKGTFRTNSVPGFNFQNDGKHYTRREKKKIAQYDLTTGKSTGTIFDAAEVSDNEDFGGNFDRYSFSDDEQKLLIKTGTERIYRRSTRANFFIWDRQDKQMMTLSKLGKQSYASFNPQADKVAFVRDNNLFYKDLKTGQEIQITQDGKKNHIINGGADWVYEEEFSFAKAFEWSPDGEKIAFMRFDESRVKEFTMTMDYDDVYPEYVTFKYPKVGEENAIVSIHIYDVKSGKTVKSVSGEGQDIYFPRIRWTQNPNRLCIFRLNRHQNELELLLADARTGKTSMLLKEENKWYIAESHFDNLIFLKDKKHFTWTSEQDGHSHIYLYNIKGQQVRQLTKGDYDVTSFYGVDEEEGRVYYQAAEKSPLDREIYAVDMEKGDKKVLAGSAGWNRAQFSSTFDYFVNSHSSVNTPPTYTVYDGKGKMVRQIEENAKAQQVRQEYSAQPVEFFSFETADKVTLNGWMIKPPNFDENRQYPVFMYVYGGPGSQTVVNSYGGSNGWWFQMLAQKGYIVASVDNRGTGARGEEFKKMTYLQLGKYETLDQIAAGQYIADLPYTDKDRIGIFGWSYGGYMSSLCILKGNEVFKAAIAVAPVTNWKWYDTIYTERYMRTSKENKEGYRDNSPIYFADKLKGDYLLIHGVADDNVHFQNTSEMAAALIKANKQFDTYFYPNRNHGIYGDNARMHLYTKMTNFILEKL
ncbi:MAG: S9 family peptidase [Bacteroidota bacterium]